MPTAMTDQRHSHPHYDPGTDYRALQGRRPDLLLVDGKHQLEAITVTLGEGKLGSIPFMFAEIQTLEPPASKEEVFILPLGGCN